MGKRKIYKEDKNVKIKRRREAKAKRYSKSLNIKVPSSLDKDLKASYMELYRHCRKQGVNITLLERINRYNYGEDIAKLGDKVEPIKVEIALLSLANAMSTNKVVDPMDVLEKDNLLEARILDALAINTLWLECQEAYPNGRFNLI